VEVRPCASGRQTYSLPPNSQIFPLTLTFSFLTVSSELSASIAQSLSSFVSLVLSFGEARPHEGLGSRLIPFRAFDAMAGERDELFVPTARLGILHHYVGLGTVVLSPLFWRSTRPLRSRYLDSSSYSLLIAS
jgi:hypothetical protein